MQRPVRWLLTALIMSVLCAPASAASRSGWDGTWSGVWGGKASETTSITVAGDRVVSYSYKGVSHPVASSNVSPKQITYEDQGNTVTLTKKSETTADAALHGQEGDATAELTRQ